MSRFYLRVTRVYRRPCETLNCIFAVCACNNLTIFLLPFSKFNTHSLIQFTSYLLQFLSDLYVFSVRLSWAREGRGDSNSHASSPISEYMTGDILPGICWFETADRHPCLVSDPRLGSRGVCVSHPGRRYIIQNNLRDTLDWPST